jgi:hypothetical protein
MVLRRPLLLLFTQACIVVLCFATAATNTDAFVVREVPQRSVTVSSPSSSRCLVVLSERRWNFNEGQEPWGMKKNAEIWNGRVAQVRCLVGRSTLLGGQNFLHLTTHNASSSFTFEPSSARWHS